MGKHSKLVYKQKTQSFLVYSCFNAKTLSGSVRVSSNVRTPTNNSSNNNNNTLYYSMFFGKGQCFPLLTAALAAVTTQGSCKHKSQRKILFLPVAIVSAGSLAAASRRGVNLSDTVSAPEPCAFALSQRCGNNRKRTPCRPGHDSLTNTQHKKHTWCPWLLTHNYIWLYA